MKPTDMPLAAFDLETTGPDPLTCRIVTASIVRIGADRSTLADEWLLDPGIEIPEGAAKVHGITTEHAREHGIDYATGIEQILDAVGQLWDDGHLVVVMNAPFDVTILDREGKRVLGRSDYCPGALFDPLVVDKRADRYRKGGRTLTDLARVYKVRQDNAHQSTGDCLTTARVAWRMLRVLEPLSRIETTDQLMQLQQQWRAEQQDSLRAFWQGRGDERWRTVSSDWPLIGADS